MRNIRTHLRFGFEGFFSIYEKGHWETNSNNILKNMVIFPDNMKHGLSEMVMRAKFRWIYFLLISTPTTLEKTFMATICRQTLGIYDLYFILEPLD